MWWRVIAVIAATVVVFTLIDAFDLGGLLGARTAEDARAEAPVSASRQLFWNFLFVAVVLTALMAAARRALTASARPSAATVLRPARKKPMGVGFRTTNHTNYTNAHCHPACDAPKAQSKNQLRIHTAQRPGSCGSCGSWSNLFPSPAAPIPARAPTPANR